MEGAGYKSDDRQDFKTTSYLIMPKDFECVTNLGIITYGMVMESCSSGRLLRMFWAQSKATTYTM